MEIRLKKHSGFILQSKRKRSNVVKIKVLDLTDKTILFKREDRNESNPRELLEDFNNYWNLLEKVF